MADHDDIIISYIFLTITFPILQWFFILHDVP